MSAPIHKILTAMLVAALLPLNVIAATATADQADKIEVYKEKHELHLIKSGRIYKSYKISLGDNLKGPKRQQGDEKTPEGKYTISGRNPNSHYHLSLRISYPNAEDIAWAKKHKVNPGGDIMIHGLPNGQGYIGKGHLLKDWTNGCIALTNDEIEEVWKLVPDGTSIEIFP